MMFNNEPHQVVAACALITRTNGDILMVKTGYRPGWEVPGGQVEIGESPIQAAFRETLEESGITTKITTLTGIYNNMAEGLIIFAFLGDYVSGDPTASRETPEVAWVKRENVLALIEVETMIDRVRDMLQYDGKIIHKSYTKNPYTIASVTKTF